MNCNVQQKLKKLSSPQFTLLLLLRLMLMLMLMMITIFISFFVTFVAKIGAAVANGSPVSSRHQLCINVLVTTVILLLLGHTTAIARLSC